MARAKKAPASADGVVDFVPPKEKPAAVEPPKEAPKASKRGTHAKNCACVACRPKAGAAKRHAPKKEPETEAEGGGWMVPALSLAGGLAVGGLAAFAVYLAKKNTNPGA